MEQIIVTAVIFVIGIGIGALGRDFVRTGRRENAFTRRFGEDLDGFLARFREATGVPVGVIDRFVEPPKLRWENLPSPVAHEVEPDGEPWPDDEEDYPRDQARVQHGAARLPVELRSDGQQPLWPVNQAPVSHRRTKARGDDTQQFSPAEVLEAAGIGGAT